jgi:hypothetical protein
VVETVRANLFALIGDDPLLSTIRSILEAPPETA